MGSVRNAVHCDVLVIGAGLSGIAALYKLRKLGLNVKVVESGSELGGTWYWNKYPGARVDSEFPYYQLNIPEVWKNWNFTERFPDRNELRAYFKHIDHICNLSKDTYFNARAYKTSWDEKKGLWTVLIDSGMVTESKYLVVASGSLDKSYTPNFPRLSKFKGEIYHSREWPENASLKGRKVAVIGAGATGIQVVQESAKLASELSVFIRRPSTCLPMVQRPLTEQQQVNQRAHYADMFRDCRNSWSGFPLKRGPKAMETSPEEREAIFEETWAKGGFAFLAAFSDARTDPDANRLVYDYWKKRVRARISDPAKREILAPTEPLFYFGTKRSPLEQDYYELIDRDHVKLVSLLTNPFDSFTETGFESFTGSYYNLGLRSRSQVELKDTWASEIHTYMGLLIDDYPNCFTIFGPQGPTTLYNAPTTVDCQTDLMCQLIMKTENQGVKSVETTMAAEDEWAKLLDSQFQENLVRFTESWWTRANIPGARVQPLTYLGGLSEYEERCKRIIESGEGLVYTPY